MRVSLGLRPIFLLLLVIVCGVSADDDYMTTGKKGPLKKLREKFEDLPPAAKVGTTAAAGFVTSKLALKTFVSAAKIAGAVFITSEVLSVSGVLDDMPSFVDDHVQTVSSVKDRVLVEAKKFRKGVRDTMKKERLAAFGFAGGAFVGMVV